jgi:hypothetical protein
MGRISGRAAAIGGACGSVALSRRVSRRSGCGYFLDGTNGQPLIGINETASAPPTVYSVNGREYVEVAPGGNRGGVVTTDGDAVWSFSLNGTIDEVAAPPPVATKTGYSGPIVHPGEPVGQTRDLYGGMLFDGTVHVADYFFTPQRTGIPVATTLDLTNDGSVAHTATATDGSWDTGEIAAGQTISATFNQAGTWGYACTPHPWMIGQIVVR